MIVIGERINATTKRVAEAIVNKDATFIRELARRQADAGSDYLDVNAGTGRGVEQEIVDIKWAIDTVQEATDVPLCLDSSDPQVLLAAMAHYNGTEAMINSVNADPKKLESLGRLAAERQASLVALVMREGGIPNTVKERLAASELIMTHLARLGVREDQVFFDPLLLPISVDTDQGLVTLKTIEQIKSRHPSARTVLGLSNVSFGLPNRGIVNRAFLLMAASAGLDAAILDPLDAKMMSFVRVADMLTGKDASCREYIRAYRKGKLIE
ncbi:MAG: dihydropteroate synthase [Dehalococcoidia bacterium]|nr:dihydropteroate synthase [Dehalococcoidia bacterium]